MNINYTSIDWLTATTKSDSVGNAWYELFVSHAKERNLEAFKNRQWSNGFYSGMSIDGLKWGYSDNLGYIMMASGESAMRVWDRFDTFPTRVTRLDLCVDVIYRESKSLAKSMYDHVMLDPPKRPKYTYFQNSQGGSTLYVGSRQSPYYGRLYDKGNESNIAENGRLWRFEVEVKKPNSIALAQNLWALRGKPLEMEITNFVGNWFANRGIVEAEEIINGNVKPILVQKVEDTPTRKLAWLRTQVAPTIRQLVEAGLGRQVAKSLMLDHKMLTILEKEERLGYSDDLYNSQWETGKNEKQN